MRAALTESDINEIARVCHEANRAYCTSIGDNSHADWYHAPAYQRESVIKGVRLHVGNPAASPAASHEEWLREKELTGWGHGPVKDEELKTHPCMVPFDQLPLEQRRKDHLFKAVVNALTYGGEDD